MNFFLSARASWVWWCQDHQYSLRGDTQMATAAQTGTCAPQGKHTLLQNSNANTDWTPVALEIPTLFTDTSLWKNVSCLPQEQPLTECCSHGTGNWHKTSSTARTSTNQEQWFPREGCTTVTDTPWETFHKREMFSVGINSSIFLYYSTCVSLIRASASSKQKTSEKTIPQE